MPLTHKRRRKPAIRNALTLLAALVPVVLGLLILYLQAERRLAQSTHQTAEEAVGRPVRMLVDPAYADTPHSYLPRASDANCLADLGAIIVLFVCAQHASGVEGVGELFGGRSGFLDALEAFPLPRTVTSSDQLLLGEPAVDGQAEEPRAPAGGAAA